MQILPTLRAAMLWIVLLLIAVLAVLSVVGAFLGADRAAAMFNSPPMAGFWTLLTLMLAAGLMVFTVLRRSLGQITIHLGCVLVLAGGMWGSRGGHAARTYLTGHSHPRSGYMILHRGQPGSLLLQRIDVGNRSAYVPTDELPFALELTDAKMEYYKTDETPMPAVKDYLATLRVLREGKVVEEKTIEVNDPLHAEGYQFTLHTLDAEGGQVLLQVISDDGLWCVYAGFAMLTAGAFWQYWIVPAWWRRRRGQET